MEKNYNFDNPVHCIRYVVRHPYSMAGGYENCLIMNDGYVVCSDCLKDNYKLILHSTKYEYNDEWVASKVVSESELESCWCENCNKQIGYQEEED